MTAIPQAFSWIVSNRGRPVVAFVAAWVLTMIALPIARWIWGDSAIPMASTISTIFQFLAVTVTLLDSWPRRRVISVFLIVAVLTWTAEYVGYTTGFPFGSYSYTGAIQPQVLGVPLIIPLAWFMMLAPSWAVAYAIIGERPPSTRVRLIFAVLAGLAMTAWDLYLDPQMVGWGFWEWQQPGLYFGIPLVNFAGWFAVATAVSVIIGPRRVAVLPLLVIYGVVWVFQAIGLAIFWGQPGPAFFGFCAMGIMLGAALLRARRKQWTP